MVFYLKKKSAYAYQSMWYKTHTLANRVYKIIELNILTINIHTYLNKGHAAVLTVELTALTTKQVNETHVLQIILIAIYLGSRQHSL